MIASRSYRAPEYREMTILALEPDTIANAAEVTDADAEAAYQKLAGKDPSLGRPRSAICSRSCFPMTATRPQPRPSFKAGASFRRPSSRTRGLSLRTPTSARRPKDAMLDKDEANAVFALPQGGVSDVQKSQFWSG